MTRTNTGPPIKADLGLGVCSMGPFPILIIIKWRTSCAS